MYKVKSRPWSEIAKFYRSMVTDRGHVWLMPMLGLVEQIQHAEYAGKIFGSTSLARLRISYLPEFDPDKEVLNIDLNHETGEFEFEYQETASTLSQATETEMLSQRGIPRIQSLLAAKQVVSDAQVPVNRVRGNFGTGPHMDGLRTYRDL